ncbi:S8 family serine peptidase [Pontibacter sp. JH31]|uniref:S8 family serine peptidase n=1 Tax=Pontibacter aquaedesilientis TaxID=2766980 RepID=A0ABR7XDB6_9BACT|nr:S8 family serine peptidase [Pontibacter aquaedesilientis]MBD1396290.1 S8 family serine peptidase [Pontibacter aquaedesilientis]
MQEQFQNSVSLIDTQHGQAIPGQYIVVFKNSASLRATGVNALNLASRGATNTLRERMITSAGIERSAIEQNYEGAVNGFAARLTQQQLDKLRQDPEIAYVEQDRIIALAKPTPTESGSNGGGKKDGSTTGGSKPNGKGKTPTEPAPVEPAPIEPAPVEEPVIEQPQEPEVPTAPAPEEPLPASYTKITPLVGENLPWHIAMNGFGDGTGKTVYVIDSGVDTDHPDLNVDLSRSRSLIYGDESVEDGYGHGTQVAGVIAAKNNGTGMIGVAANASIVALRVFDNTGYGTVSRAISAVNYVTNTGKPGDVVNMSLGSGVSSTLDNAVMTAASKGIFFAIASGNSAVDCSMNSPARVDAPGVYTVSAMDRYHQFWSSSNYGAPVDFTAPGVNITTTRIGGGIGSGSAGTSYASPHVAGILLLRGEVFAQGIVNGDKDSWPDPIASVE